MCWRHDRPTQQKRLIRTLSIASVQFRFTYSLAALPLLASPLCCAASACCPAGEGPLLVLPGSGPAPPSKPGSAPACTLGRVCEGGWVGGWQRCWCL
jgi:hypothetical protein